MKSYSKTVRAQAIVAGSCLVVIVIGVLSWSWLISVSRNAAQVSVLKESIMLLHEHGQLSLHHESTEKKTGHRTWRQLVQKESHYSNKSIHRQLAAVVDGDGNWLCASDGGRHKDVGVLVFMLPFGHSDLPVDLIVSENQVRFRDQRGGLHKFRVDSCVLCRRSGAVVRIPEYLSDDELIDFLLGDASN